MSLTTSEFLRRNCKVKSDGKYTHTSMGINAGSFYVSKEMTSDFLDIYEKDVFDHGVPTHINEVPDQNRHSPLKIDFDFTYKMELPEEQESESDYEYDTVSVSIVNSDIDDIDPDGDGIIKSKNKKKRKKKEKEKKKLVAERRYTKIMIDIVITMVYEILYEWCVTPMPEEQRLCFVMEKERARFKDRKKGIVKDGIHLMWPYLVCPFSFQHKIRSIMLKRLRKSGIFDSMELIKPLSDVYDQGIIEGNWLMYGSCKQDKKGKIGKPYLLSRIAKYEYDEEMDEYGIVPVKIDRMHYTNGMLIRILSIRMREGHYATLKLEKVKEIEALEIKATKEREDKRLRKLAHKATNAERNDEELKIIFGLIDILDPRRADNYQEWIQLVWCCHNIHNTDERLLEKVIEFSKKSEKYVNEAEDACREKWNDSKDGGLGEGTLYMAKEDNYAEYKEVFRVSIWGKIRKCAMDPNFNPYDIADITYDMYQHQYVCVDTDKNVWYKFKDHRWRMVKGPTCLKKNLSTEVFDFFCVKPNEFMTDNEVDPKKWAMLVKNASQLKQTAFKNNVIKECQQFFNDEESEFLENLDENRYLIAFKNGILDLASDEMIFRDGRPDDNISFSTKTDYNPNFTWDSPLVAELMRIFETIQPKEENREFLLTLFASMLDGSVSGEKFYIFTGTGANGKGLVSTLLANAFGDYAGDFPVQVLTSKRSKPGEALPEIARLKGARVVIAQEPEEGQPMNASILKEYSGGDPLQARLLFGNPITFIPQWTMIVCCNELPPLPPMDGGVWRRVRVVDFGSKFVDNPDPDDKTQFKRDSTLKEKIPYLTEAFVWILVQYYKKNIKLV